MIKNQESLLINNSEKKTKENILHQHSVVIWMCGLSGSGKSTIANGLEKLLSEEKYLSKVLDGDNIRAGLNKDLDFSDNDRIENLRRIAEVSKLFLSCGIITINAFISPSAESRVHAKKIIGEENFIEVFINAPLSICEKRDTKGLYSKARQGLIKDFTGIGSAFEPPSNPNLEIRTDKLSIEESVKKLYDFILPKIEY